MVRVRFHSGQHRYTHGAREAEFLAEDYPELRRAILAQYSEMPEPLLDDIIVAIDGEFVHRPFLESLGSDSEVVFVGRIEAG